MQGRTNNESLASVSDEDALEIRHECREFVKQSVRRQSESLVLWGILTDWRHSYMSASKSYESQVLRLLADMNDRGLIY